MSKAVTYTQCEYRQPLAVEGEAWKYDVAWIPTEFAKKGKLIRIDGLEGTWEVVKVGSTKPEDYVLAGERDHMKQRSVSDIRKAPTRVRGHMGH